jgi:hypothetical protein
VGFSRRPRWRRRGARRREDSGEEVGQCSGPEAATRGEEAIGVVELNREGAEGGVRRGQELTGEEGNDGDRSSPERRGTTAGWFRWKSGHEEWPGSVSEVRERSPGGRSVQWEADGGGPRRTEGRRSGRRRRRWCSGLGVRAAREREGNGLSAVCWCYWAEEGRKKSRRGHGTRQRRGGSRVAPGLAWRARERPAGEGSRTKEGGDRRVEFA